MEGRAQGGGGVGGGGGGGAGGFLKLRVVDHKGGRYPEADALLG